MQDKKEFRSGWRSLAVSGIGLLVAVLVAAAIVLVDRLTGFNLYSFKLWLVVPIGALLTGFAAAAGYYFGSVYLHTKASLWVAIQMVAAAALANFLIYYLDYYTYTINGVLVRDTVDFGKFLSVILTHQEMRIGRGMVKSGEVGTLGYWIATIDFIGFIAGGLCLFAWLNQRPTCSTCPRYLHARAKTDRYFENSDRAAAYYDGLFARPVNDPAFAEQALLGGFKPSKAKGGLHVVTKIMECPECSRQTWTDSVKVWGGKEWKDLSNLKRVVEMPLGTNVVPFIAARRASAPQSDARMG